MTSIAITGAAGRMGRRLVALSTESADLKLVGAVERGEHESIGKDAGELAGWESVQAALDHLRPSRIGHGVRAIENPDLARRIAAEGVVLECCPVSNVELKVFPTYAEHPFPKLKAAGCKVTLSSDDAFHCLAITVF